ncbi:hypothetical protein DPMN_140118 [Dreissena polymorpha]|uniref:Uncharacterized protein n=1 Tax=Dreissena polymorpha TaxID=45954 RepID=A0A9D4G771_DREPO|nr:hypothetical protein DPMN_140118 [Dreissena polymorpha]
MKYLCSANSSRKRNCSGIRVVKHVPHKGVCARLGTGTGKKKLVRVSFSERECRLYGPV